MVINGCGIWPHAQCRGVDLRHANLAGKNLAGADFTGANMVRVDLRGANLAEAIFDGADLTAVSYTHLDVYKRQGFVFAAGEIDGENIEIVVSKIAVRVVKTGQRLGHALFLDLGAGFIEQFSCIVSR